MTHSNIGTVVASYGARGILETSGDRLPYILKGRRMRPVCGDTVEWQPSVNGGEAIVEAIQARRNELQRPDTRGKTETLAANLSTLAIVLAPEPAPDFYVADRFLCAAELLGATGLVVWNKADLDSAEPAEIAVYAALGYPLLRASAQSGDGVRQLETHLTEGFGMLVGQSLMQQPDIYSATTALLGR